MTSDTLQWLANWATVISVALSLASLVVALIVPVVIWIWPKPQKFLRLIRPSIALLFAGMAMLFLGFSLGISGSVLLVRFSMLGTSALSEPAIIFCILLLLIALVGMGVFLKRYNMLHSLDEFAKDVATLTIPTADSTQGGFTAIDLIRQKEEVKDGKLTPKQFAANVCSAVNLGVVKRQAASDMLSNLGYEVYRDGSSYKVRMRAKRP